MACNAVFSSGVYESFLLTTVIILNSKKNQVLLVGLPFLPTPILICSHSECTWYKEQQKQTQKQNIV